MDIVVLLVGKSGSGKDTIANRLCKYYNFTQLKSYTTRPMRYSTENTHTFITDEEFDKLENIVAYTEFNGYRYCATQEQIDNSDIYIIDPDGINYLYNHYNGNKKIISIYVDVNPISRFFRMIHRKDTISKAFNRIMYDRNKFKKIKYDYIIMNKHLEVTCLRILSIIGSNANGWR